MTAENDPALVIRPATMNIVILSCVYSRTRVTHILWKVLGLIRPLHHIRAGWESAAAAGEVETGQKSSDTGDLLDKPLLILSTQVCNLCCCQSRGLKRQGNALSLCVWNQVIPSYQVRYSRAQNLHAGLKVSSSWNRGNGHVLGLGQRWRCRKLNLEEMRKRTELRPRPLDEKSWRIQFCWRGCWMPSCKCDYLGLERLDCLWSFVLPCLSLRKKSWL